MKVSEEVRWHQGILKYFLQISVVLQIANKLMFMFSFNACVWECDGLFFKVFFILKYIKIIY